MNPLLEPQRTYTPPLDASQLLFFIVVPGSRKIEWVSLPAAAVPGDVGGGWENPQTARIFPVIGRLFGGSCGVFGLDQRWIQRLSRVVLVRLDRFLDDLQQRLFKKWIILEMGVELLVADSEREIGDFKHEIDVHWASLL